MQKIIRAVISSSDCTQDAVNFAQLSGKKDSNHHLNSFPCTLTVLFLPRLNYSRRRQTCLITLQENIYGSHSVFNVTIMPDSDYPITAL